MLPKNVPFTIYFYTNWVKHLVSWEPCPTLNSKAVEGGKVSGSLRANPVQTRLKSGLRSSPDPIHAFFLRIHLSRWQNLGF